MNIRCDFRCKVRIDDRLYELVNVRMSNLILSPYMLTHIFSSVEYYTILRLD